MQNFPLFRVAALYILATIAFYGSTKLVTTDLLDSSGTAIAWSVAIASFGTILASMWMLYRAVPLPGMLCIAMSVTVLGISAALEMGAFDAMVGMPTAKELSVHAFMAGVVLLVASVLLMPSHVIAYFTHVVLPALLGRKRD